MDAAGEFWLSPRRRARAVDLGRYVETRVLGTGSYGMLVQATDPDTDPHTEWAIELVARGPVMKVLESSITRQLLRHSSLQHPFFVSLREVFLTSTHLAIVMELAHGGDLCTYMERHKPACRLPEASARWIFQQLIIGMDYSHRRGFAARDTRLHTLLLDRDGSDGTRPLLQICDFGYSHTNRDAFGTPVYIAPEILQGCKNYDAEVADVWSCGVVLHAMLFGAPSAEAARAHMRGAPDALCPLPGDGAPVSAACADLLARVLAACPRARLPLEEVMRHPWFLQDLPAGALAMNAHCLRAPPAFPGEFMEHVYALVDAAAQLGVGSSGAQPRECVSSTEHGGLAH